MNYTRIHQSNNHQLFINDLDEVVIGDQSGMTPDETDDGPLIVAPDARVEVQYSTDYGLAFLVPVLVPRTKETGKVAMILEDFRALHKQLPDIRVKAGDSFKRTLGLLNEAWVMVVNTELRGEVK